MVRDEADIVAETVGRMRSEVDEVTIIDNGSNDGTGEILRELGVRVVDDDEVGFHQAEAMTRLACSLDSDWVVPFDADEIWLASDGGRLAETLAALPAEAMICEARIYNHVVTGLDEPGPPVATIHHRRPWPLPERKVACRVRPTMRLIAGNHDARYGRLALRATGLIEVRHFPYRSPEQMVRKVRNGARALRAADHPSAVSAHWRDLDRLDDERLRQAFEGFHFSATGEGLIDDPCPAPSAPRHVSLG